MNYLEINVPLLASKSEFAVQPLQRFVDRGTIRFNIDGLDKRAALIPGFATRHSFPRFFICRTAPLRLALIP